MCHAGNSVQGRSSRAQASSPDDTATSPQAAAVHQIGRVLSRRATPLLDRDELEATPRPQDWLTIRPDARRALAAGYFFRGGSFRVDNAPRGGRNPTPPSSRLAGRARGGTRPRCWSRGYGPGPARGPRSACPRSPGSACPLHRGAEVAAARRRAVVIVQGFQRRQELRQGKPVLFRPRTLAHAVLKLGERYR